MHKINFWIAILSVTASGTSVSPVVADVWPQKSVRFIVPTGAGSPVDASARLFAEQLGKRWRQSVVVENRPGADGLTAVAAFASNRDDHTLLYSFAAPVSVFPALHEKLPYDPSRDLVPISWTVDNFVAVAANASLNLNSLKDLAFQSRSKPGSLNYNASAGALPYVFADFLRTNGLNMVLVSYREAQLAVQDLLQGRLHVMYLAMSAALPAAESGKVRLLAVSNKRRAPMAPDVPTASEAGFPDFNYEALMGIFGPRDMPIERRDRISADIRGVAQDPVLASKLSAIGQPARASTAAEFSDAITDQRARMEAIVRALGTR